MPFKPNYNFQRAERERLKQAKQEAKRQERAESALRRKAEEEGSVSEPRPTDDAPAPPAEGNE